MDKDPIVEKRTSTLIMFYVGGLAGMTLLINAVSCGPLLEKLGMTSPHASQNEIMQSLEDRLRTEAVWLYLANAFSSTYKSHDKEALRNWVSALRPHEHDHHGHGHHDHHHSKSGHGGGSDDAKAAKS